MTTQGNQRVMVAVRVRPMLTEGSIHQAQEKFELQGVYRIGDTSLKVELTPPGEPAKSSLFNFDYIFDQESTQLEVYEDSVVDMVDAALVGINSTILAYGQTGSGKTFSVLGDVKPNPLENDLLTNNSGIFLRVLSDLMDYKLRQAQRGWHVVIGLSCIEIYVDNTRDLFGGKPNTPPPPLKTMMIGEDVILPSLIVKEMTSLQAVFNEIQLAIARRQSRATDSNAQSSRSHCLFTVDILQQSMSAPAPSIEILDMSNKSNENVKRTNASATSPSTRKPANGGATQEAAPLPSYEMPFQGTVLRLPGQKEPVYASKMIIADLAGSERIGRSGVSGQGAKEATAINSSLTALGNVVHNLHEGSFPSYRSSKLTSMLKPTFSQTSSRTLLLAQCSPTQLTFDETISTLHFANKVKAMKVTTTTGAEAEKLQFDFLETEKTYDSLLADLHIFAVEMYARSGVIRRKVTQNKGVYYDPAIGNAKGKQKVLLRDRRPAVEGMGAIAAAEKERAALLAKQEEEKRSDADRTAKAIQEEKEKMIGEHKQAMKDAKDAIEEQRSMRLHHAAQQMILESAARGNQLVEEEAAAWAAMQATYLQEHKDACEKEVSKTSQIYEKVAREINRQRLSATSHETPETMEDNKQYAASTWGHCAAKRFFSNCMELREDQMTLISITRGNAALEKWKEENAAVLLKFKNENTI